MDSATNRESVTKAFYRGTRPSARTSAPGLRAARSRRTSSPCRCSRASRPGPCHSAHFEVCAACPAGSSRSSRGFQRRLHAAGRAPSCSCRRRSDIETPAGWHSTVPCTRSCPRPLPLRTQFLTLFDCFGPETARVLVGGLTLVKRHVYPRVGLRAPAMGTLVERLAEALVPNQQMRVASVRWSHCAGAEHRRRAIGRNGGLSSNDSLAS